MLCGIVWTSEIVSEQQSIYRIQSKKNKILQFSGLFRWLNIKWKHHNVLGSLNTKMYVFRIYKSRRSINAL